MQKISDTDKLLRFYIAILEERLPMYKAIRYYFPDLAIYINTYTIPI